MIRKRNLSSPLPPGLLTIRRGQREAVAADPLDPAGAFHLRLGAGDDQRPDAGTPGFHLGKLELDLSRSA